MIYTLTLNASLDYVVHVDELVTGKIHKSSQYSIFPGGKGINVSQVLCNLGVESTILGFVAGHTGNCLEAMLKEMNLKTELTHLSGGITRVNVKTRSHNKADGTVVETDINGAGPVVSKQELGQLNSVLSCVSQDDYVIVSGSVPPSISSQEFDEMLGTVADRGAKLVVDCTGEYLLTALKHKPFLVKPNEEELRELFDDEEENVEKLGFRLVKMGACNVLISLGASGAVLCTEGEEVIRMNAPKGTVVNTVGAGDSMVAGFIAGYLQTGNKKTAVMKGICAGSATAFSEGLAVGSDIERLMASI